MKVRRPKTSAGILLYRDGRAGPEVFLVHPGGPFWAHKDAGAWSIPKGEYGAGEDPLEAARRELLEETGAEVPGPFTALRPVRQTGGKVVTVWAARGHLDPSQLRSNTFSLEWPPRSGVQCQFPEVDRGAWFTLDEARGRLLASQRPLLEELGRVLGSGSEHSPSD